MHDITLENSETTGFTFNVDDLRRKLDQLTDNLSTTIRKARGKRYSLTFILCSSC